MADIDDVLERVVTDATFRSELARDPGAALAAYDLSKSDLELLAGSLDSGDDAQRGVEQRTSKSAVVGLLASLSGGGGGHHDEGLRKHVANIKWSDRQVSGKGAAAPGGVLRPDLGGLEDGNLGQIKNQSPIGTDELAKLPGRPKVGEISVSRDMAPGSGGTTDAEALTKLPGKPKPGEITLTRSSSGGSDPTGVDVTQTGAKRQWPIKMRASDLNVKGEGAVDPNLAPPSTGGPDENALYLKLKNATVDAHLAPPSASGPDDDALHIKLRDSDLTGAGRKIDISPMKAGDTGVDRLGADPKTAAPADFLTIEDA